MPELTLDGLGEPFLAHHLCALGVFRAIARQLDPEATLHFRADGVPALRSSAADREQLVEWVLSSWIPSPMLSPWNSGAGFGGSSKAEACVDKVKRDGVQIVEATDDARLAELRRVISDARKLVARTGYDPKKTKAYSKEAFLRDLRVEVDEALLPWIDAAAVVELDMETKGQVERPHAGYLPILGTGGNDGRLDLSNNVLLHLCRLIGFSGNLLKRPKNAATWSRALLASLLFGDWAGGMANDSAGQFMPSSRAAPNGVSGSNSMEADKLVNPWLFVWSLEGTLLFGGAATRRLGSHGRAHAAFPFHADPVGAGYGTAALENVRAELWLPTWDLPATYRELRRLFGEARAQVGRRRAQTGIDYALAAATLGSTRGLRTFERYSLAERAGQSYIAVHVGSFPVHAVATADRLRAVDGFARRMHSVAKHKNAPPRLDSAVRSYEDAVFALTRSSDRYRVEDVLAALGRLERERVKGTASDAVVPPLHLRDASWLDELAQQPSRELLLASALAALSDRAPLGSLASYLGAGRPPRNARGWGSVDGAVNLTLLPLLDAVANRRLMELASPDTAAADGGMRSGLAGHASALRASDIDAYLRPSAVNEARVLDLVWALSTMPRDSIAAWNRETSHSRDVPFALPASLPRGWAVMRLSLEGSLVDDSDQPLVVRAPMALAGLLRAGQPDNALRVAERALKSAGVPLLDSITAPFPASVVSRLLTSFLFPLPTFQLRALRRAVSLTPNLQENR